MAITLTRENFFLHKLHSLSGIIPVGFYMVQHLTLNSFVLASPEKFNAVVGFFDNMPLHFLLTLEICLIWAPLAFHMIYGFFIWGRGQDNYVNSSGYRYRENLQYLLQRISGGVAAAFLIYHVASTTVYKYMNNVDVIQFNAMHERMVSSGFAILAVYAIGVLACSYHLSFGVWNFCIRWGITVSEKAQQRVQRFSMGMFIVVCLLGWAALAGFVLQKPQSSTTSVMNAPVSAVHRA